jgi:hypothetical protein
MRLFTVRSGARTITAVGSVTCLIVGLSPLSGKASVAEITLRELIDMSDLIVVATVTKVEKGTTYPPPAEPHLPPPEIATARVLETWKGTHFQEVSFLASPTWTCDISDAKQGERVVLFLRSSKESRIYCVAHSGRGRMPLREVGSRTYATIWVHDVQLPRNTVTIPDPADEPTSPLLKGLAAELRKEGVDLDTPEFWTIRSVAFDTLKELVIDGETKEKRRSRRLMAGFLTGTVVAAVIAIVAVRLRRTAARATE